MSDTPEAPDPLEPDPTPDTPPEPEPEARGMTCDTSTVTPPGSAVWYDPEATAADVLAILRLTDADVDATASRR